MCLRYSYTLQDSIRPTSVSIHYSSTTYVLFVCFPGAALAVILAIAVAIGMIIFLIGLIYIRRFGPPWFCTYSENV